MSNDEQEKPYSVWDLFGPHTAPQRVLLEHGQGGQARYGMMGNPVAIIFGENGVINRFTSVFTGNRDRPEEKATLEDLRAIDERGDYLPEVTLGRAPRAFQYAPLSGRTLPDTSLSAAVHDGPIIPGRLGY